MTAPPDPARAPFTATAAGGVMVGYDGSLVGAVRDRILGSQLAAIENGRAAKVTIAANGVRQHAAAAAAQRHGFDDLGASADRVP